MVRSGSGIPRGRYDPDKHHRRSTRLQGYDYSEAGAYFVTVCLQHRECLFGEIADGSMYLNDAGSMVSRWWRDLEGKFSVEVDQSVVMPNHFHGVLLLKGNGSALARVIGWFKTMTTNRYIHGVKTQGWRNFPGRLWQRGYYDHVVRDREELARIREYILHNPQRWAWDSENPAAIKPPEPQEPWAV